MIISRYLKEFIFTMVVFALSSYVTFSLFYSLFNANEVIIFYGFHPFDICSQNPQLWRLIKFSYIFCFTFSIFVGCHVFYVRVLMNFSFFRIPDKEDKSKFQGDFSSALKGSLSLLIGTNLFGHKIYVPECGLYQNFLVTGTIGSGKTSSAMYPFTRQLMEFNANHFSKKIGMLFLDVKGNYCYQVYNYAKEFGLEDDLITISLDSNVFYNPLHKPNLKPQVLANRLKTILLLFSENNSESYWLDKAEEVLTECIKLCRLYNDNYVTFSELHKLVTDSNYYKEKVGVLRDLFVSSRFTCSQIYELNSSLNFFQKEFENLDDRTKGILVSEITRITNAFVSDFDVMSTFCSPVQNLSFSGFSDVIRDGKIVVLNMNISEYSALSRIIAAYLKLDFQSEVMSNLSNSCVRTTAFICDEYDKYATKLDGEFFSMSREAKCINIVSTQSYSSLKSTLRDDAWLKVITQNLINKIWFRTDDVFTIEDAQKQLGKEDKERVTKSISESAKRTNFSYVTNTLSSQDSNISETFSTSLQNDYKFDTNFFTQGLETFSALGFLSDGNRIFPPQKLLMLPYFKN